MKTERFGTILSGHIKRIESIHIEHKNKTQQNKSKTTYYTNNHNTLDSIVFIFLDEDLGPVKTKYVHHNDRVISEKNVFYGRLSDSTEYRYNENLKLVEEIRTEYPFQEGEPPIKTRRIYYY